MSASALLLVLLAHSVPPQLQRSGGWQPALPQVQNDVRPGSAAAAGETSTVTPSPAAPADATAGSVEYDFTDTEVNGYSLGAGITIGRNASVRLTPGYSWRGYGVSAIALHVSLERDTGGGWRTVSTTTAPVGDLSVPLPLPPDGATRVRYRLRSSAYTSGSATVRNDAVTSPLTVRYEDQQRYRGLAKRMYVLMQPYCPTAIVHVVSPIDGRGDLAGQAQGPTQRVLVKAHDAKLPEVYQRSIALHECAHLQQYLNYGASAEGDRLAAADEAEYFRNDDPPPGVGTPYSKAESASTFQAVEHAADCSSIALEPKGYLGYGGWCSPSERRRGAWLMQGKRYDGHPGLPT